MDLQSNTPNLSDRSISKLWHGESVANLTLIAAAVAVALTVTMFRLVQFGRLSRDPGWDDLSYVLMATDRIDILRGDGAFQAVISFFTKAPHSFYSELVAFTGLVFSSGELLWVYGLNAGVIVLLVFFIFRLPELGVSLSTTLLLKVLFILGPVGFFLVDEFRPDTVYFLAVWVILVLRFRLLNGGSSGLLTMSYVLLGMLWFVKPSFLLVSLGLFVVAATLDLMQHKSEFKTRILPGILGWLLLTVLAAVTVLPNAVGYVMQNTVGENEEIWVDGGVSPLMVFASNIARSLLFVLGPPEWVLILGTALLFFSLKQLRSIQRNWIKDILVFYAVIIIGMVGIRSHSVFFGIHVVFGTYIFAVMQVLLLRATRRRDPMTPLVRLSPRLRKLSAILSSLLLTIGAVLPPNSFFTASQDKKERFVNQALTSVILSHCSQETPCGESLEEGRGPEVFVGTISAIDSGVINWYLWNQGLTKTAEGVSFFPGDDLLLEKAAMESSYIVLLGEGNRYKGNLAFKSTEMQSRWRLELKQSSSWNLISSSNLYFVYAKSPLGKD